MYCFSSQFCTALIAVKTEKVKTLQSCFLNLSLNLEENVHLNLLHSLVSVVYVGISFRTHVCTRTLLRVLEANHS